MHAEWSRQCDFDIAVLPGQGGVGMGTGTRSTSRGKGGFMSKILIEFIKECCLAFSVLLGLSIPNSNCVICCFSKMFIRTFLLKSTSHGHSN